MEDINAIEYIDELLITSCDDLNLNNALSSQRTSYIWAYLMCNPVFNDLKDEMGLNIVE